MTRIGIKKLNRLPIQANTKKAWKKKAISLTLNPNLSDRLKKTRKSRKKTSDRFRMKELKKTQMLICRYVHKYFCQCRADHTRWTFHYEKVCICCQEDIYTAIDKDGDIYTEIPGIEKRNFQNRDELEEALKKGPKKGTIWKTIWKQSQ